MNNQTKGVLFALCYLTLVGEFCDYSGIRDIPPVGMAFGGGQLHVLF
jgi:hypothetical protein